MLSEFSPHPDRPILVIGAAGIDIVGRLKGEPQPQTSSPAFIRMSFGGVARNVAENLARLGQPVNLITAVGMDDSGDRLLAQVAEAGVGVDQVVRTADHPTGIYLAVVNSGGGLQYGLDDMRAISALTAADLRAREEFFQNASLLFVDANLPKETLRAAFSLAKRAQIPICADPTSRTLASKLLQYMSRLHLITPNSSEAALLCEHPFSATNRREVLQAAKHLLSKGVEIVIITLAEFGVCYATSTTSGFVPAIRTAIIDPTGAGDALTSTVLFALLNEIPLDDAVRLGVSAASLTLGHRGAVLPDLSLEKLYDHLVI
jgi:pseudouridine kinase